MDNLQGDPKEVDERWTDVDYDDESNCSNGEVTFEGGADDGLEPHGLPGAQPAKDEVCCTCHEPHQAVSHPHKVFCLLFP